MSLLPRALTAVGLLLAPIQFLAVQRIDARTGWISVQSAGTPMLLRTQHVWVTGRDRGTIAETLWASDNGGQTWRQLTIR